MRQAGHIVAIGDPETVFGFSLLGADAVVATDRETARAAIRDACRQPGVALVLVEETWAELIRESAQEKPAGGPLIVPIPGSRPLEEERALRGEIQRLLGVSLEEQDAGSHR